MLSIFMIHVLKKIHLFSLLSCSYIDNRYPIWLDDVKCDDNTQLQHILSCNYSIVFGIQKEKWPCSTSKYLIIKCGKQ